MTCCRSLPWDRSHTAVIQGAVLKVRLSFLSKKLPLAVQNLVFSETDEPISASRVYEEQRLMAKLLPSSVTPSNAAGLQYMPLS